LCVSLTRHHSKSVWFFLLFFLFSSIFQYVAWKFSKNSYMSQDWLDNLGLVQMVGWVGLGGCRMGDWYDGGVGEVRFGGWMKEVSQLTVVEIATVRASWSAY
jgi:hypothetical protein